MQTDHLYSLKIGSMLGYGFAQKLSFWLLLLYFLFEYLRPQSMYPAIAFLPWMQIVILFWFFTVLFEGKLFSVSNPVNKTLNLLFIVVILSSLLAFSPRESFAGLQDIIILILCYYLIIYSITNGKQFFIFIVFYLLLNFKLSHFAFIKWVARGFSYDRYGAVVGFAWLRNPGEFAIQMCIAFAISTYFILAVWPNVNWIKKLVLIFIPVTCFGSVLASGSRGAFLGLAFILMGMWFFSKKKIIGSVVLVTILLSSPFLITDRDMERLQNMGSESDSTAQSRLERWEKGLDMIKAYPVLGVGYYNWAVADQEMFHGTGALSHNIFIECASELGLSGLLVFLLLIYFTLKNNRETRSLASELAGKEGRLYSNLAKGLDLSLLAYLVTGFFVTVFYYPFFWINLGMTVALNNVAKIEAEKLPANTD